MYLQLVEQLEKMSPDKGVGTRIAFGQFQVLQTRKPNWSQQSIEEVRVSEMSFCAHNPIYTRLFKEPTHIFVSLDISVTKHWNLDALSTIILKKFHKIINFFQGFSFLYLIGFYYYFYILNYNVTC